MLLRAMCQPKTFYVLGAGTSAGLVPFTLGLRENIKCEYGSIGLYPVEAMQRTPLFERVVGVRKVGRFSDSSEALIQNIPSGTLDLLVQREFSYSLHGPAPAQYALLQRVGAPGVFFTFNLDGLARAHLSSRHLVFEPHGVPDREWTESVNFSEFLEISLDMQLPYLRPKLLPGPEPSWITDAAPYVLARQWLRTAPAVVVLGYSFGRFRDRMDDTESFEYFIEHLAATRCLVFVVSPAPHELTELIEQRLHARRVLPVMLYWDIFTQAAMSKLRSSDAIADWICCEQVDLLERAYIRTLERCAL